MKSTTKALRDAVKHIKGSWVRVYRDGTAWAGAGQSATSMREVKAALEARGYHCDCRGKSGTSGEYIVDVIVQPCCALAIDSIQPGCGLAGD